VTIVSTLYPCLTGDRLAKVEATFAEWKAHLDAAKAAGKQGRYPTDVGLAEMALDRLIREEQAG
jgi:hypothetical protein